MMLPDLLAPNLKLVICGTAAGKRSATRRQYYAGSGNRFWSVLAEVGLTPRRLDPSEYRKLIEFGIGLTDVVKGQSGMDAGIDFSGSNPDGLRGKIEKHRPHWLCFNGKKAAQVFLGTNRVSFGPAEPCIGSTDLFVAPSTSGAAGATWDPSIWKQIADLASRAGDS